MEEIGDKVMKDHILWEYLKEMKGPKYKWVDLSHEFSADTPHYHGFLPLDSKILMDFDTAPCKVYEYTFPGQYGTHVDIPAHFDPKGRTQEQICVEEFAYPLCVIDKSEAVKTNPDYALTIEDIKEWEAVYGVIPENAFVAFRSDWHKRGADLDNRDSEGKQRFPGWKLDAVKWLVEERKVGSIGHETSDTDPPALEEQVPYKAEGYILSQDKFQIELMKNLDKVPPAGAIIFCTFQALKGGTGFPVRCFAVCPTA